MRTADLYALLESAGDAAFVVDMTGTICYWSARAEQLLGFSGEQTLGRNCAEVLAGTDETGAATCLDGCRVLELARTGSEVTAFDVLMRTASDDRKWVSVSILAARVNPTGSLLIVHLLRDIDNRKRLEGTSREILTQVGHLTEWQADEIVAKAAPIPPVHLTARETSVLGRLAQGASTSAIAGELVISPATLRNHIQHILAKLGCHSRLEAVLTAVRRGLI